MKFWILGLFIAVSASQASALEYGCQLHPKDIKTVGTRMVKSFADKKQSVPNSLVITAEFRTSEIQVEGQEPIRQVKGTLEGFYRPSKDDFFSLIPIPVLGIALSRNRNMVYLCANFDDDPAKTHVTVYMLRGYYLDPNSYKTVIGNIASGPVLEVKPLTAAILGISKIQEDFLFLLKWMPFMEIGFEATNGIQRFLANVLGDFTGIGVERLTMTYDALEIATGVNLQNPRKAMITKTISLKPEDLNKK